MNAEKIVEKMFLGSSDGLAPVGVKELVFISGKSVHLSRLGVLFPNIQQSSWKLDACHHLIGGLNGALSESAFLGTWSHRLTPAVRL